MIDIRDKFKEFIAKRIENPYPIKIPDISHKSIADQESFLQEIMDMLYRQDRIRLVSIAFKEMREELFSENKD